MLESPAIFDEATCGGAERGADDAFFERWMQAVDNAVRGSWLGLPLRSCVDHGFREWFDGGMSPADAAARVLADPCGFGW